MFINDTKSQKEIKINKSTDTYKDTFDESILLMQNALSNSAMNELLNLEEENDDNVKMGKMRAKNAKDDDHIEEFKKTIYSKKEEQPKKLLDIELDMGKVQIGYSKEDNKSVIAIEKKTALDQTANEKIEKQVVENQSYSIRKGTYRYISGDKTFKNGAVVIKSDIKNDAGRIINKINEFTSDTESTTTVDKVLPFLNTENDKKNLNNLKKQKNFINLKENKGILTKDKEELSNQNKSIEKNISQTNTIIVKKEAQKLEFKNKLIGSLDEIKEASSNDARYSGSWDDYYLYMKKRWLEMADETKAQNKEELPEEDAIKEE